MSMPYPPHTALAGDTDVYIRTLAEAADRLLTGVVRFWTASGSYGTDANGDIFADFGAAGVTLSGCLISIMSDQNAETYPLRLYGQLVNFPQPPSGYPVPGTCVDLFPREFNNNGGVWCRVMTSVYHSSGAGQHAAGSYPAKAGQTVYWKGIAWQGTS